MISITAQANSLLDLAPGALDKFNEEQVVQLHELYKTAKGLEDDEVAKK